MKRTRINSGLDLDHDWSAETREFYQLELVEGETLSQFHARLVEQAKKCNFRCLECDCGFEQRIIRDRLQLFVDPDLLKSCINPTSEEILAIHEEDQKGQTRILADLTMAGMIDITKDNPKMKEAVKLHLTKGHALVIDEDTAWKYPIDKQSNLYAEFASLTTNLVIDGVHEFDIDLLVQIFPDITELTVKNAQMDTDSDGEQKEVEYPTKIRKLHLINSTMEEYTFTDWLQGMTCLEELYICDKNEKAYITLPDLPHLQSLTLLTRSVYTTSLVCPLLKRLTLNHCWNGLQFHEIRGFGQLEYLKIVRSVDWKYKEQIESLQLKTVDVFYMEVPKEKNLILKLNEDCIMQLKKYLSASDWMALHECHPRFQWLPIENLAISAVSLTQRPVLSTFGDCRRIGPLVSSLEFMDLDMKVVEALIPFFPNLKELGILSVNESKVGLNPTGSPGNLSSSLRKLNSSLKSLWIMNYSTKDLFVKHLRGLSNIQKFRCNEMVTDGLLKFLGRNQIQKLNITFRMPSKLDKKLWLVIGEMCNLKRLEIFRDYRVIVPKLPAGALPQLETLIISSKVRLDYLGYENLLMSLDCQKLKLLQISGYGFKFSPEIFNRMKGLEKLVLDETPKGYNFKTIPTLTTLTNLKCLIVPIEKQFLLLIQGLPQLQSLTTETNLEKKIIHKIRTYLKSENRKMCINAINYE